MKLLGLTISLNLKRFDENCLTYDFKIKWTKKYPMKKRDFLKNIGALGLTPFIIPEPAMGQSYLAPQESFSLTTEFKNEDDFWKTVRDQYDLNPNFINLESGYYNIIPQPTLQKNIQHMKRVNLEGSYYMRNHRFKDKEDITHKLGAVVGCSGNELIVTRNTTESLDLVISGFPWKKGDEAIYAIQDYGAMQDMFEQVAKRHHLKLNKISVPNHPKNDQEIVDLYESQINKNTKLIMVCHMINITGQILPIKKI